MSRELHDTDGFFKTAYKKFEDTPSAMVWEKINADLDKKNDAPGKRGFILWRRFAILLVLLPISFILFDTDMTKTGAGISDKNAIPVTTGTQKISTLHPPEEQHSTNKIRSVSPHITIEFRKEKYASGKLNEVSNFRVKQQEIAVASIDPGDLQNAVVNGVSLYDKSNTSKLSAGLPAINNFSLLKKQDRNRFFKPYWLITAFVSYDQANYMLDSDVPDNITSIKHREVHEPSFSGGVLATRQLTSHWGLQTGLIFSHTVIGISPQKMYAFQDPAGDVAYKYITSSGYAYIKPGSGAPPSFGDSLTTSEAAHSLNQVSVPLSVRYRMEKNKLSVTPGAGIMANFLTSARVEIEIEDASHKEIVFVNKLSGAKSFYWSTVIDVDVQYKLSKKLSLNLQPTFQYALSPITENEIVETFPYSFGIRAGLTLKF